MAGHLIGQTFLFVSVQLANLCASTPSDANVINSDHFASPGVFQHGKIIQRVNTFFGGGGRGWKPLFQDLSFLSARPGKIIIIKKKKVRFFFVTYVTPSPCNTKSSPGDHHTQRRWTDDPRPSIRSCAIFCARCGWCLCYSPDRWPDKKGNKK